MFPAQRRIASTPDLQPDTERRVLSILSLVSTILDHASARHVIFPLFVAGIGTLSPDAKIKTLELLAALEGSGIGRNTARTRGLLKVVFEEQRRAYEGGGSAGEVEWLGVARERGLGVVNCGL